MRDNRFLSNERTVLNLKVGTSNHLISILKRPHGLCALCPYWGESLAARDKTNRYLIRRNYTS